MANKPVLLSTTYLGPVAYYVALYRHAVTGLEVKEHFEKQSYRNRCTIYGANGKLDLIVPIQRKTKERQLTSEIKISYCENWQKLHWKSFSSAYRSSPYFEYYEHEFKSFYKEKYTRLMDFNHALQNWLLQKLRIEVDCIPTESWVAQPETHQDWRNTIHPKRESPIYWGDTRYQQVFENKAGFLPNLSMVDLLFNEGPNAITLLDKLAE